MKKSFTKKLLVLCLSAALAIGAGFGFAGMRAVEADSLKYNFKEIVEQYAYNSKVTIPNRVSYNNKPVSNGTVTFPNGIVYATGTELTLDQFGTYTVSYNYVTATVSRLIYDTFVVNQEYFTLSTNNGSYVIDSADMEDQIVLNHSSRKESINVALKEGCEILFNKPVDLNKVGENGLCDVISVNPIIGSYIPTYDSDGKVESSTYSQFVDDIVITLTDAYDSSIFVTYRFDFNESQTGYAYIRSGTNTQEENGITPTSDSVGRWDKIPFYYNDVLYMSWFGAYGGQGGQSMSTYAPTTCFKCGKALGTITEGMTQIVCSDAECGAKNSVRLPKGITLQYDPVNKYTYFDSGSGSTILSMFSVADSYSSGTTLFSGFTTGEVFVSMKAETYLKPTAYVEVLQVGDVSGAEFVSNINQETLVDNRAPQIVIDAKLTDGNGVYAAVGDTFYIPSAKAYDVNLASNLNINVYKDYGQVDQTSVNVNASNNTFVIDGLEVYTIEYSAVDASGNVGKSTLTVNPVDVSGNLNSDNSDIFLNKGIYFKTNKIAADTFKSGHVITLPEYALSTLNDEGSLKLSITANANGKTYNIDPTARTFIPETTGTYTITYAISDNVSSYVETYTIDCSSDGAIRFATEPFAYRYYIAGMKYEIEKPMAYKYEDKPVEVPTTAYASFDGGAWEEITDVHNFLIKKGASNVRFEFRAEGATPVAPATASKIIDVASTVTGESIAAENYFQFADDAFTVTDGSDIIFTTNHTKGSTNTISFINPITYGTLTLGFKTFEDKANFSVFNVILTDIYDPNNKVVIKLETSSGALYASVNGTNRTRLTGDKFFSNKKKNISYDYNRRKLTICGTTIDYEMMFSSEYVYVDFELVGITEESAVAINTIQAVNFSKNLIKDNSKPSGYVNRDNGNKKINSVVTIYSPAIADVLTPTLYDKVKVSAIDDEGNYAVATDGTILNGVANDPRKDYDILLNRYTTYTVTVEAKDVSTATKDPLKELYKIYVIDDHAPVITLTHGFTPDTVMNVDLGLPFKIEYTVTDDITPSDEIIVSVVIFSKYGQYAVYASRPHESLPDGVYELTTDECILTRKGEYTLYIEALDSVGNASYVSYKLNVQ